MTIRLWILKLLSLCMVAMAASAQERFDYGNSDAYVRLYLEQEFSSLAPYTADDLTFIDRFAQTEGRTTTLKGFATRAKASPVSFKSFTLGTPLYSGNRMLYPSQITFTLPAEAFGAEGEPFTFSVPMTLLIRIKDDLVSYHEDIMDVPEFQKQMREQMAARGE
ncbi:hypothetical protein [Kordiimonas sp.]|uniref:hypothetical protein n=1 Tax=Kordiimonas sp. TaxID=1970157 RepID=UPI003A8EFB8A